jgi:hypothetical protein
MKYVGIPTENTAWQFHLRALSDDDQNGSKQVNFFLILTFKINVSMVETKFNEVALLTLNSR